MTATGNIPDPSLKPFLPTNLAATPFFCEEVYVNPAESDFVTKTPANTPATMLTAAQNSGNPPTTPFRPGQGNLQFPTTPSGAIEIKVDWLPNTSTLDPTSTLPNKVAFDCGANKPANVYTVSIGTTCYALAGIHISSKLLPNWLWATFEPPSPITNPNRCNPKLYSACSDPWGSDTSGNPSQALKQLFGQSNVPAVLQNYRLTGAQSEYTDASTGKATLLGNSFTEFNAGVPAGQASCITCHSYSQVSSGTPTLSGGQFEGGFLFQGKTPATSGLIGVPKALPAPSGQPKAAWYSLDFSWMLGVGF